MSYDKDKIVVTKEEYDVLKIVAKMETCDIEEVAKKLNVDRNALMRKIAEMERKGLLRTIKKEAEVIELTNEGKEYIRRGLPEEHILDIVTEKENISIEELYNMAKVRGIDRKVVNIGIMHLARLGVVKINKGYVTLVKERLEEVKQDRRKFREFLSDLIVGKVALKDKERYIKEARRRKLIQIKRRSKLMISITDSAKDMLNRGAVVVARLVTRLTPELITSGKWREVIIKPYDLSVEVPEVFPGRKHPYMEFLDQIREILVSMGFEEVKGPHIELEFWNFDALFQAQDHPAREIHDT
ncbi:MAG TPA: MarR family transcriptional regulator, partial [Euryarchaeota archaeon]|nr:MarR family transcriptional regulator [Euryarchaeota archaeon]